MDTRSLTNEGVSRTLIVCNVSVTIMLLLIFTILTAPFWSDTKDYGPIIGSAIGVGMVAVGVWRGASPFRMAKKEFEEQEERIRSFIVLRSKKNV